MNLVIVNCTYDTFTPANSGAIGTWVYEVSRAAEADGVTPLVVTRTSPHPQHHRPNTVFIEYPRLPAWSVMGKVLGLQKRLAGWVRPRQGAWCARVARAIRNAGAGQWPIILHNDMELAATLRRKFPQARIIHFAHNSIMTTPRFRQSFPRVVDVALAVSNYTSRWNENFYQMPSGAVKTVYNGVDLDAFIPRQDHATPHPILSYAGKLDPAKGPDIVLKAALRLAARTRDFSVQIIGRRLYDKEDPDDYEHELQRLAADLGNAGVDCRFTGWMDRNALPAVMGKAHIHVTPSRVDEAFGLTTIEAMACGSAVIGSNTGGTSEVIGDAGFIFEREDDGHLANLLEPLIRDPALRAEYGRRARVRAGQFSWAATWRGLKAHLSAT
jgi:glycosyltransferase involved in cell wall biosynthesis